MGHLKVIHSLMALNSKGYDSGMINVDYRMQLWCIRYSKHVSNYKLLQGELLTCKSDYELPVVRRKRIYYYCKLYKHV